ncbi:MAG: hypothetical protein HY758_04280 [Nitrospirae bacterium]|nr:hypothetical protein [Nitrospirota bacterium]
MKKIFVIIAAVLMIFVYSAAFAGNEHTPGLDNETGPADIVVDVLLTRPIGLVGLVAGTAVFFVTLPIAAISNRSLSPSFIFLCRGFHLSR